MENQMDNTGTWLTDQNISESGGRVRWPGIAALFCGLTWLAGSPSLAQDNDNWATPWSALLGVELESRHKSGGAPAWDWQDYPTVFMATDNLGFGGLMGGAGILQMQPGLSIFDAASHEVIATVHYDVLSWDWENPAEPHGLGVSPDGAWIYLPTGERKANGNNIGRLLIISA